jgi:hypothetical protein
LDDAARDLERHGRLAHDHASPVRVFERERGSADQELEPEKGLWDVYPEDWRAPGIVNLINHVYDNT